MAPRIFLAVTALLGIMWFISWYNKADPVRRNNALIGILLYGLAALLLLLVVTGRIPWLFALFSAAVPWINRALMVRQMWQRFSAFAGQTGHNGQPGAAYPPPAPRLEMSAAEALQVLGLEPGASREEITAAHKKLMQRIHPDKGGSSYLASRINQAKDLLLSA